MYNLKFRYYAKRNDIQIVKEIVESTGFFYDFEIPIAISLVESYINGDDDYEFIFVEIDGKTIAYSCYGESSGTIGGYDLYWIVTHNDYRGLGIGKQLLEKTHDKIIERNGRYVIAETSSTEKYTPTRYFYEKNGYINEAIIKDFYLPNDNKIFYIKRF